MSIQITGVRNLEYANAAETVVSCEVRINGGEEWLPFGATPHDPEIHGQALYLEIISGDHGPIAPYQAPEPPQEPE